MLVKNNLLVIRMDCRQFPCDNLLIATFLVKDEVPHLGWKPLKYHELNFYNSNLSQSSNL